MSAAQRTGASSSAQCFPYCFYFYFKIVGSSAIVRSCLTSPLLMKNDPKIQVIPLKKVLRMVENFCGVTINIKQLKSILQEE